MSDNAHDSDIDMHEVKDSSTAGEVTASYQPTSKENAFFYSVCMNLIGKPEVNWDKVSQECGHKDAGIAKIRFQQILKKCIERGGPGGAVGTSDLTTPVKKAAATRKTPVKSAAKPRTQKASPVKKENGADVGTIGSGTNDSPKKVKKAKTAVRKKVTSKLSEPKVDEDDVDDDMNAFQPAPRHAFSDETDDYISGFAQDSEGPISYDA